MSHETRITKVEQTSAGLTLTVNTKPTDAVHGDGQVGVNEQITVPSTTTPEQLHETLRGIAAKHADSKSLVAHTKKLIDDGTTFTSPIPSSAPSCAAKKT